MKKFLVAIWPTIKKGLQPILAEVIPVLINQIAQGKTKFGVYLLGIFGLSMTFFFGPEMAETNQAVGSIADKAPPALKAVAGAGVGALSIGVAHDLIKRTKGAVKLFGAIRSRFKNPF